MTDDPRAVPEAVPELRSVVELRRTLQAAGAPEAEIERRVQARLRAIFRERGATPGGCAQCDGTGWVSERRASRLHPFPISAVRPCTCPAGQRHRPANKRPYTPPKGPERL